MKYVTTGGNLDISFFYGGNAKEIIREYHNFIGLPTLPPLWSLGWGASSYGYRTLKDVQDNIDAYANANIPLENVWLDITYMKDFSDFFINETAFPEINKFA